jgi:hypothetical protein
MAKDAVSEQSIEFDRKNSRISFVAYTNLLEKR